MPETATTLGRDSLDDDDSFVNPHHDESLLSSLLSPAVSTATASLHFHPKRNRQGICDCNPARNLQCILTTSITLETQQMDIMRPPLEQQVAPAPWLVARSNVDVPALIRRTLSHQPDASVDDIVRQFGAWGVQMSGIIVSMWMPQLREQEVAERIAGGQSSTVEASPVHEITSSCTCNPLPCICCEPTPAWGHQDCCGILVSEEQTKSRDKYLEHTWFASMSSDDGDANRLSDQSRQTVPKPRKPSSHEVRELESAHA